MAARREQARGEFPFHGGRWGLDLAATLGRRHTERIERLPDTSAVERWLLVSGVAPAGSALAATEAQRGRVIALRESVYRIARAACEGTAPAAEDIDELNRAARLSTYVPQLRKVLQGTGVEWTAARPVDAALARIARDSIELFGSPLARRVKECALPACSRLFVDESPSGRRRWCSMEECGNITKVASYRKRTRSPVPTRPSTTAAGPG